MTPRGNKHLLGQIVKVGERRTFSDLCLCLPLIPTVDSMPYGIVNDAPSMWPAADLWMSMVSRRHVSSQKQIAVWPGSQVKLPLPCNSYSAKNREHQIRRSSRLAGQTTWPGQHYHHQSLGGTLFPPTQFGAAGVINIANLSNSLSMTLSMTFEVFWFRRWKILPIQPESLHLFCHCDIVCTIKLQVELLGRGIQLWKGGFIGQGSWHLTSWHLTSWHLTTWKAEDYQI